MSDYKCKRTTDQGIVSSPVTTIDQLAERYATGEHIPADSLSAYVYAVRQAMTSDEQNHFLSPEAKREYERLVNFHDRSEKTLSELLTDVDETGLYKDRRYKNKTFCQRSEEEKLDYVVNKAAYGMLTQKMRIRLVVNNLRRRGLLKTPNGKTTT